MRQYLKFYIDGKWVDPVETKTVNTVNPATEEVSGIIALGTAADVDRAVKAARKAFPSWSQSSREERLKVLERILVEYQKRVGDLAAAVTEEMGAPKGLANGFQVGLGLGHLAVVRSLLGAGAQANAKTNNGATALLMAAQEGHRDVVLALLQKGAKVNAKEDEGIKALILRAGSKATPRD